ncbi:hypothetical protein EJD04_14650 [Salmonella enterica]|nr:hypothetical protein [Salmonella enterica subsp. enterica serovar Rubislaw]EAN5734090.1 hypothetical protein [Salmonella enterica]EDW0697417.1 hypothetical protein [Salmonella enterica subsp. enterica]EDW0933283.1 hypothetical protein [Salmonella enterica subsp. enterica serovar Gaminara]EAO9156857.1 hypothetical protein [Salmonella enterica]
MKENNIVISRKWIFYSLFLLSPGILAAEKLNFNYTLAGELNLEPRLGLQAKACHSKSDPMDIRVRFGGISSAGGNFNVTLAIQGTEYPKSYSVFTKTVQSKQSGADPDFMVPWEVSVNGNVSGLNVVNVKTPGSPARTEYSDAFCFFKGHSLTGAASHAWPSGGFIPVFTTPPYVVSDGGYRTGTKGNASSCNGIPDEKSETYYWPDYYHPPYHIDHPTVNDFYTSHVFYRKKTVIASTPATTNLDTKDFNNSVNNEVHKEASFTYTFPFSDGRKDNATVSVRIDKGEFLFRLNNRNISALTLTITDSNASEVWSWKAANDDAYKNRLYLNHQAGLGIKPSSSDASDPYLISKFYKENRYYKGTLTPGVYLTSAYTDYIRNIIPLSLPSTSDGEINLVNTDSLIFTIGQAPNAGGYGSMLFRAYGQPLKFAPLTVNGKEVASAMQIRNACY